MTASLFFAFNVFFVSHQVGVPDERLTPAAVSILPR